MDRSTHGRASRILVIAGVVGLAGCAYRPGSFRQPLGKAEFRGERATAGCLDVAVLARTSATASQVVEVHFANRCDRPTVVDFPALRSTGRDAEGREHALAIYDPAGQLRPLTLEARVAAREVIELQATSDAGIHLTGACLDIAALARAKDARWICVTSDQPPSIEPAADAEPEPAPVTATAGAPFISPDPSPTLPATEVTP